MDHPDSIFTHLYFNRVFPVNYPEQQQQQAGGDNLEAPSGKLKMELN